MKKRVPAFILILITVIGVAAPVFAQETPTQEKPKLEDCPNVAARFGESTVANTASLVDGGGSFVGNSLEGTGNGIKGTFTTAGEGIEGAWETVWAGGNDLAHGDFDLPRVGREGAEWTREIKEDASAFGDAGGNFKKAGTETWGDLKTGKNEVNDIMGCKGGSGFSTYGGRALGGGGDVVEGGVKGTFQVASGVTEVVTADRIRLDDTAAKAGGILGALEDPLASSLDLFSDVLIESNGETNFCSVKNDDSCEKSLVDLVSQPFNAIAVIVFAVGLFISAFRIMYSNSGRPIAETVMSLGKVLIVITAGAAIFLLFGDITDELTANMMTDNSPDEWKQTIYNKLGGNWIFNFLASVLVVLAVVIHTLFFFTREIALLLLASTLSLAAAGQMTASTKAWLPRVISVCVGVLLYKPIMMGIFWIGFQFITWNDGISATIFSLAAVCLSAPAAFVVIRSLFSFTDIAPVPTFKG